jgi:predicted dehydrogenase
MVPKGTAKVKVGVVGVGYLGKFHVEKYARLPEVDLVGVVDSDPLRAQGVADQFQVQVYPDQDALMKDVDAVSVVVPTVDHHTVTKPFLETGVDVLLEKPMTSTLEEADELIEIANAQGAMLQIGHLERFNSAILAIQGILNQPLFIESHRLGFFQERGTDTDVILDVMIHDIDIILAIAQSEVASVRAVGVPILSSEVDIANARLEFSSGCVANVTASRISDKSMRKIRIFQPDAYLSIDYAKQEVSAYRKIGGEANRFPDIVSENIHVEERDCLEEEIKAFIESVSRRRKPLVSGDVGRDALKVALEISRKIKGQLERHGEPA